MSDFNPKQGQMILVGTTSDILREFVAMDNSGYICRSKDDAGYVLWPSAKPLPCKPEPTLFTYETWPKQVVYLRASRSDSQGIMLTKLADWGVSTGNHDYTWEELKQIHQISLDFCQTWQPCHYIPESK